MPPRRGSVPMTKFEVLPQADGIRSCPPRLGGPVVSPGRQRKLNKLDHRCTRCFSVRHWMGEAATPAPPALSATGAAPGERPECGESGAQRHMRSHRGVGIAEKAAGDACRLQSPFSCLWRRRPRSSAPASVCCAFGDDGATVIAPRRQARQPGRKSRESSRPRGERRRGKALMAPNLSGKRSATGRGPE